MGRCKKATEINVLIGIIMKHCKLEQNSKDTLFTLVTRGDDGQERVEVISVSSFLSPRRAINISYYN